MCYYNYSVCAVGIDYKLIVNWFFLYENRKNCKAVGCDCRKHWFFSYAFAFCCYGIIYVRCGEIWVFFLFFLPTELLLNDPGHNQSYANQTFVDNAKNLCNKDKLNVRINRASVPIHITENRNILKFVTKEIQQNVEPSLFLSPFNLSIHNLFISSICLSKLFCSALYFLFFMLGMWLKRWMLFKKMYFHCIDRSR